MNRCVFHVGSHKTGTSSIQRYLYHAQDDATGYLYGNLGGINSGDGLAHLFLFNPTTYWRYTNGHFSLDGLHSEKAKALAAMEQHIEKAKQENKPLLFSWEGCWSMKPEELAHIRQFMEARGFSVEVIAYIRAWKGLIESAFQQRIKMGLKEFNPVQEGSVRNKTAVEKFEQVFGADRVTVFKYDVSLFPEGDVVRHFCQHLQIPFDESKTVHSNDSLRLPAIKLLYAYNTCAQGVGFGPSAYATYGRLLRKLSELKGPSLRLHACLFEATIPVIEAERPWLEARLGGISMAEDYYKYDNEPYVIKNEEDMYKYEPEALEWLARQINRTPIKPGAGKKTARAVALQVRALYEQENCEVQQPNSFWHRWLQKVRRK